MNWRAHRLAGLWTGRWVAIFGVAVASYYCQGDDLGVLREQIRQLQEQNRALQQQLEAQKQMMDALNQKVEALGKKDDSVADSPRAASDEEVSPGILTRTLSSQKLLLSGQGAIGLYHQNSAGQFSNSGFVLDEAKLFVDANIYKNFYVYNELLLTQREDPDTNLRFGELYLEWENILEYWGKDNWLNLRLGRMNIPFGEEYQVRDAILDPLISHSLTDLWGVDEGIELYGSIDKVRYALAVQNGGYPELRDFNADKSVALRVSYEASHWLGASVSAMRTGALSVTGDAMSALWFGNGFIRSIGAPASTTHFEADLAEGDLNFHWNGGHLALAGGWLGYDDNDTAAGNQRNVYYYSAEGVQNISDKFYGAIRGSQIFAPNGFPLVGAGQFASRFYGNLTTELWRLSVGVGYRWNRDLVLKAEYSLNGGRELGGKPRNHEDFLGLQAAFRF